MIFDGLIAYPITPFHSDGEIDVGELETMICALAVSGVDAITVLGSSGSFAYLSPQERSTVARTAVRAARATAPGLPVMVGISSVGTREVLDAARDAESAGASGLVLSPVSYVPLHDDEVSALTASVCAETSLPVCLYNNPRTTQFSYRLELVAELLELPQVVAFKDTAPDVDGFTARYRRLRALSGQEFSHGLSGDALIISGEIAADAWHSGPAALLPRAYAAFRQAVVDQDLDQVAASRRLLLPVVQAVGNMRGLSGLHSLARACGIAAGDPRPPILPVPGSEQRDLARMVDALEGAGRI